MSQTKEMRATKFENEYRLERRKRNEHVSSRVLKLQHSLFISADKKVRVEQNRQL